MKPIYAIPLLFLAIVPALSGTGTVRKRLPLEVTTPVEKKINNETLWDLTQTETAQGRGARFLLYGDTVLSETVEDWRRWFALQGDTLLLQREESLRKALVYEDSVVLDGSERSTTFKSFVRDSEDNRFVREGIHLSTAAERCRLVIVPGDTAVVTLITEDITYSEIPDPLLNDEDYTTSEGKRYHRQTRRWLKDNLLPEAIMVSEWSIEGEKEALISETCHVIDPYGNERRDEDNRQNNQDPEQETGRILEAMQMSWTDGKVTLTLPDPMPVGYSLDILTDQGLPVEHREIEANSETSPSITISGVLTGRIMAVVTTPWNQIVRMLTKE